MITRIDDALFPSWKNASSSSAALIGFRSFFQLFQASAGSGEGGLGAANKRLSLFQLTPSASSDVVKKSERVFVSSISSGAGRDDFFSSLGFSGRLNSVVPEFKDLQDDKFVCFFIIWQISSLKTPSWFPSFFLTSSWLLNFYLSYDLITNHINNCGTILSWIQFLLDEEIWI